MSIRIGEPNCKMRLLGIRGNNEYWLGDDNYVYQFRDGVRIGYLCSADAWERTFSKNVELSPSTKDISTIKEYGLTQKLTNSIRCF